NRSFCSFLKASNGSIWRHSSTMPMLRSSMSSCVSSIRNGVTIAARIGAGESVLRGRIDHYGGSAARHSKQAKTTHVVAARLQFVVNGVRDCSFHVQFVESRRVRPERSVEVQRLDPRPLESGVQVRIPVAPEVDNAEKHLKNRLSLIVAARRADAHH